MKITDKEELKKFFQALAKNDRAIIDGKEIKCDSEIEDFRFRYYPIMDGSVIKVVYIPKTGKRNLSKEGEYYQQQAPAPSKGKVFIGNLVWVSSKHMLMNNFLVQSNNMDWTPTTLILDRIEEVEV